MNFSFPRLIGLTGKAGSGKDTVANFLERGYGYTKYSLAQPLKEMLNGVFGWSMELWQNREWKECPLLGDVSPRKLAQWLGTDILRKYAGEDIWIKLMEDRLDTNPCAQMVVADVRFENEARAIHVKGGIVIQLVNPDAPAVAAHSSEAGVPTHLIDFTATARMGETEFLIDQVINYLEAQ